MNFPLEGIRILDLSQAWAMPGGVMYLADQGADVIKVEPFSGDICRVTLIAPPVAGESRCFFLLNRNKRGIAVDISKPEGREIIYKIAKISDVMMHNMRLKATEKLGFTYETMCNLNPRLIYVALSAYGTKGPLEGMRGYDRLVQAVSGIYGKRRLPDGTPVADAVFVADASTPTLLAYAVTLALFMREKTGQGQKIETSLLNLAIAMQAVELISVEREEPQKEAVDVLSTAMNIPYRCADGKFLLILIISEKEFADLCRATGVEHLASDPELVGQWKRALHNDELYQTFDGIFSTKSREEWIKILWEHDVPSMPIVEGAEVFSHPQMLANDIFIETTHPVTGKIKMMDIPFKMSGSPRIEIKPAPQLGEHTEEVLRELGYSAKEIKEMEMRKVVLCGRPGGK